MSMKKILTLFLILLTASFAASSAPALTVSEGNIDGLTLYSPQGTKIDSLTDIGESGMVISTSDAVAFASDYGDISLGGDSLLAVTGFDVQSPSVYLLYGEMTIAMKTDLPLAVFTPSISTVLNGEGSYGFVSTDDAEIFRNLSDNEMTVRDGIRGTSERIGAMEEMDFLAWPRHTEAMEEEPAVPSAPEISQAEAALEPSEPVVVVIPEKEIVVPSAPSVDEPSIALSPAEPVIIDMSTGEATPAPAEAPEEIIAPAETAASEAPAEPEATAAEPAEPAIKAEEVQETAPSAPAEAAAPVSPIAPIAPEEIDESTADGFDIRIGARAYADQGGASSVRAALMPSYRNGSFTFTLSIDPFAILEGLDSETLTDWIGFATDFIDEISYHGDSTTLAIDRKSYLEGDFAGLFTGLDHHYDGAYPALSLNHTFESEHYSHRLWFDDLSFRRLGGSGIGGLEFGFSIGDAYPAALTIGAAASIDPEAIESAMLYPEASILLPFAWSDGFGVGLKVAAATMIGGGEWSVNPFTENGMLLSASLPVTIDPFSFEVGAAWSTGQVHYGMLGNTSYAPEAGDYLTAMASFGVGTEHIGARVRGWMDFVLPSMEISAANSFIDASLYAEVVGLRLFGGYRTGFASVKDQGEYYGGIGADLGPLESEMSVSYRRERGFALTFAASASAFGRGNEDADLLSPDFPVRASIETGFEHTLGSDTPIFTATPSVLFGMDEYSIGLRAPFRMAYEGGRFELKGFNGNEDWDFGINESEPSLAIYRTVTDSFALIDSITLGTQQSFAYFLAERGYERNGLLFSGFGEDDELAVRAGFNFPNLSLAVYADNAEAPHIIEAGFSFYPGSYYGPSFSVTIPGEMLLASTFEDYALIFYPEMRITVPFAERKFELSLYAMGEISTVYRNGDMACSSIIYDFANGGMYDYMTGAGFAMDLDTVSLAIDFGIRNGRLAPAMFNPVFAAKHTTAGTLDELSRIKAGENGMKYYASASLGFDFGSFDLETAYAVSDILGYGTDPGDYISLSIGSDINDEIRLYAAFAKEGFTSSLKGRTTFSDYISTDAVYSIGADFSFGRVGFSIDLSSTFGESNGEYVNVPAAEAEAAPMLTVKTRLAF